MLINGKMRSKLINVFKKLYIITIHYIPQLISASLKHNRVIYLFAAHNDTHILWMYIIARQLDSHLFTIEYKSRDRAEGVLLEYNEQYLFYNRYLLRVLNPKVVVLGNDWGEIGKSIIEESKKIGFHTVCIQEGVVNVGFPSHPLYHAEHVFILGKVMRNFLIRSNLHVTGNPKFSLGRDYQYPQIPVVMINCNFGYHLGGMEYENDRYWWLASAIEACEKLSLRYFISQHPADKSKLDPEWPVYRSKAASVQEQLAKSTILISQRSTLIYEAFCMGRQVVYYDFPEPYQETNIILDDPFDSIYFVKTENQLEESIKKALEEIQIKQKSK
jgi:hypothetical protein